MIGYLLIGASLYALIGGVIALIFLIWWRGSFDPAAENGSWGFRLAIVPGLVALWPLILAKRLGVARLGSAEAPLSSKLLRRTHGFALLLLILLVPPLFWLALTGRSTESFSVVELPLAPQTQP